MPDEKVATYTTDHGGENPKDTRYWIHTFDPPKYRMIQLCQWSKKDALSCIERMGYTYLSTVAFIAYIEGQEFAASVERPNSYLNRCGGTNHWGASLI